MSQPIPAVRPASRVFAVSLIFLGSLLLARSARAAEEGFLPEVEDHAITFTHSFRPGEFEKGKRLVIEGFGQAILDSGGTRRTYFVSRAESHEILAISFFHESTDPSAWMDSAGREAVLKELRPLYREPLRVRRYRAAQIHDSHSVADYYPQPGDELIVYDHVFHPGDFESGKKLSIDGYSAAIESSGLKKRSYFLEDEGNSELLIVSFFHRDSTVAAWEASADRQRVAASVAAMLARPMTLLTYRVESIHVTP